MPTTFAEPPPGKGFCKFLVVLLVALDVETITSVGFTTRYCLLISVKPGYSSNGPLIPPGGHSLIFFGYREGGSAITSGSGGLVSGMDTPFCATVAFRGVRAGRPRLAMAMKPLGVLI
jgi:hypothetical protein